MGHRLGDGDEERPLAAAGPVQRAIGDSLRAKRPSVPGQVVGAELEVRVVNRPDEAAQRRDAGRAPGQEVEAPQQVGLQHEGTVAANRVDQGRSDVQELADGTRRIADQAAASVGQHVDGDAIGLQRLAQRTIAKGHDHRLPPGRTQVRRQGPDDLLRPAALEIGDELHREARWFAGRLAPDHPDRSAPGRML